MTAEPADAPPADPSPSGEAPAAPPARRRRWVLLLPLVIFLALAGLFYHQLFSGDPSALPSALIGRPAPVTELPGIDGLTRDGAPVPGLAATDFEGHVTVLNVWASWCVPCREEAPLLMRLAEDDRIRIVGLNYKDRPDNARAFLARYGDPYAATGADPSGRAGIEWGVYGVPETFVIDRNGVIAFKLVGAITAQNLETVLKPQIAKVLAAGS
ncbi:thiol-disulfide oxidoreductase [Rhodovulum sp. PH10]|uniref:DsbE family thiol:disulfide interchange protein n=1 Tax=Rhodovulum sp. PH10 TaxID=1187851 RepID=UPI00027C1D8D|nr:DsbE family thiol:disulfide interchange protein [Rhodovulum sp. PH10]EJW13591.1 thiol-disulfide oxidoreductase [Rhodovulum sp. PH10]